MLIVETVARIRREQAEFLPPLFIHAVLLAGHNGELPHDLLRQLRRTIVLTADPQLEALLDEHGTAVVRPGAWTVEADLAAIASKIQAAGEKPNPALQAELEGIATKHGFGNFAELDDVAANISIVNQDGSMGVHNPPYEQAGLKKAADLGTAASAEIGRAHV